MWTHRKGFKHRLDGPDQQQLKERLREEKEDEYDQGMTNLPPLDHHWLDKPLANMLKLNPATQQQRLSSVANTHERYHNQQTAGPNLRQQQALLQNWLTNNNNP